MPKYSLTDRVKMAATIWADRSIKGRGDGNYTVSSRTIIAQHFKL